MLSWDRRLNHGTSSWSSSVGGSGADPVAPRTHPSATSIFRVRYPAQHMQHPPSRFSFITDYGKWVTLPSRGPLPSSREGLGARGQWWSQEAETMSQVQGQKQQELKS